MHALAIPEADPASLKTPADSAREIADLIASMQRRAHDVEIEVAS